MPSPNLSRAAAELEGLPSDGGKTVDALAGGLPRTFVRIGELETDLALVNRRLHTSAALGGMPAKSCPLIAASDLYSSTAQSWRY
jgi:hypothetical protein